ncbi:MAG: SpoIIE family protein phosphatase [Candidatus Eisenbacteria bacterium]|nr:SpoIIE family protein phosphatase [Candidatus Eisenbacteria bacterium]
MLSSQFRQRVLFPALLPLLVLAGVRSFYLGSGFNLVAGALIVTSVGLYMRQLNSHWGKGRDVTVEMRRFKYLVWLLLPLFLLSILFRAPSVSSIPHLALIWISLAMAAVSLFILFALLLQMLRLSPDLGSNRLKSVVGLFFVLLMLWFNWPVALEFIAYFLLGAWIFTFEKCGRISTREKVKLTFLCILGIFLTAAISFEAPAVFEVGARGSAVAARSATETLELLSALLPHVFHSSRLFFLAMFILLPGKVVTRPAANWFKYSLRIRTKLLLSYVLSSIIPGLLLILIFSFGVLFLMGGYWQRFVSQLIASRASTMQMLLPKTPPPWLAETQGRFLSDIDAGRISAVLLNTSAGHGPGTIQFAGMHLPGSLKADSMLVRLGEENFKGLITVNDSLLYLSSWAKRGNYVIGLLRQFTSSDLTEMKSQCGTDVSVVSGLNVEITPAARGGTTLNVPTGKSRIQMSTRGPGQRRTLLDLPMSFPIMSEGINWSDGRKAERTHSVFTVETTFRSVVRSFASTEQIVNRVYLIAFAAVAGFFGVILVLVALVGFGLAGGITRYVSVLQRGTQQLRGGDLSVTIDVESRDELGELAESFNLMVADLNRMVVEVKEKERLEAELESARAIQMRLLPEQVPQVPGFEIASAFLPATQVGGDYYDFISLPEGRLGLAVGDVSGKGMPAALLMANLQASLHALIESTLSPRELVSRLNRALYLNTASHMFATFFYGMLDVSQGKLSYVNAGHNFPILCGKGRLGHLSEGGALLGVFPDSKYHEGQVLLEPGEIVTLYSDGVTEARDSGDKEFGEERLMQLIRSNAGERANAILKLVLKEIEEFCGIPQDDVTLVVVKRI